MSLSKTSSWSCFLVNSTTRMVMGNTTISYSVFRVTCEIISDGISSQGITQPRASGKKIRESVSSPNTVLKMARAEKSLVNPFDSAGRLSFADNFIRLITYALINEPARKAMNDAAAIRGANPKI